MKIKTVILIFILTLNLSGCILNDYKGRKIISPTRKYYLIVHVNRSDKTKSDYAYVFINLYNSVGKLRSTLNTHAGDFSEWAVGWDKEKDTIILYSSDISNNAWKIENEKIVPIPLSDELNKRADELEKEKYKSR